MHAPGPGGEPRHWVLEVHLLDPPGAFGGFYEELLEPGESLPSPRLTRRSTGAA